MSSSSGAAPAPGASGPSTNGTQEAAGRRAPPLVKKQRILWDSDAASRGGKTSIAVLLDWLTEPRNYTRWRAGKSQFGETLCSEIKAEMRRNGIVHRENANIRTQISELERSYDAAVAWLVQNGYPDGRIPDTSTADAAKAPLPVGVDAASNNESSSNPIEAYVLRMCRYFYVLDAVMRPSTAGTTTNAPSPLRPAVARKAQRNLQALKKKAAVTGAATAGEENESQSEEGSVGVNETSSEASGEKVVESTVVPALAEAQEEAALQSERASLPAMTSLTNRAAERRPPPAAQKRKSFSSSPRASGAFINTNSMISSLGTPVPIAPAPPAVPSAPAPVNTGAQSEPSASVPPANPDDNENEPPQQHRQPLEDAREERERKRFRMDEEKNALECEKLRLEVQTAKLRLQVERVRARQQLADAGLSQTEIDAMVYS
ncbi:hypothetical protein Gpo141_00003230 [Globisporangium polare]